MESSCIQLSPPQPPTGQHGAVLGTWGGTVRHPVHRAGTARPVPKPEGLAWHGTALPACGAGTAQHCAAQHPELQEHGSRPLASLFTYSPRSPSPLLTYRMCPTPRPPCPHRVSTSRCARRPNPATHTKGFPSVPCIPSHSQLKHCTHCLSCVTSNAFHITCPQSGM